MTKAKYPLCAGRRKDGEPCRSVVVSLKSDEPLLRIYCAFHAARAAAAVDAEPAATDPGNDTPGEPEGQPGALASPSSAAAASGAFPSDDADPLPVRSLSRQDQLILSWPAVLHFALEDTALNDPQALADLIVKRKMEGALKEIGGPEGLAEWLRRSYYEYKCLCSGGPFLCDGCSNAEAYGEKQAVAEAVRHR